MKRIAFIIMVACLPLTAMSLGVITHSGKKPTKTSTKELPARHQQSSSCNQQSSHQSVHAATGSINGHDYVDLGLSVKWATCNVGATSPSDYGSYFAWGETSTKSEYTPVNSVTWRKSIGDIAGNPQYDAARANWGGTWRLPTKAECEELVNNCTWTWTAQDGHNGYRVTSKANGNSIFIPAAGYRLRTLLLNAGLYGYFRSSSPLESGAVSAYSLCFNSSYHYVGGDHRYIGRSVRPVSE